MKWERKAEVWHTKRFPGRDRRDFLLERVIRDGPLEIIEYLKYLREARVSYAILTTRAIQRWTNKKGSYLSLTRWRPAYLQCEYYLSH